MVMRDQIAHLIEIRDSLSQTIENLKPESSLQFQGDKANIALIVGHEEHKPGAYAKQPISDFEYFYNCGIAHLVKNITEERGHNCRIFYRDEIGTIKAYQDVNTFFALANFNNCLAIELHFNSFEDATANGSEVLMADSVDVPNIHEREFAQIMLDNIVNALGTRKRGIKTLTGGAGERGWQNVSQVTKAPSVLIEPFFGSNEQDCQKAYDRRNELCKGIVIACEEFIAKYKVEKSGAV